MKVLLSFFLLLLLVSCSNNDSSTTDTTTLPRDSEETELQPSELADKSEFYIWKVDNDQQTISQNPEMHPEYYSVDTLIMGLNERYPHIVLEKLRMGHDTLYTAIKDAQYLTEQMGSTGSEQYIAAAVINLTSVPGVNYVRMDFEEGSHAQPDVWSRQAFSNYKEVK